MNGLKKLWYIHNGILFRYKKEHIWVSSNEVDEPRAYNTECSKSERERQILCINAHTWNLERWYWQSYVQGSKGDTDVKNRLLDSVGEGEGGIIWENSVEIYTSPYVKWIIRASLMHEAGTQSQCSGVAWRDRVRRGVGRGFRMEGTRVHPWPIHVDVWPNPPQYCKLIILQLK